MTITSRQQFLAINNVMSRRNLFSQSWGISRSFRCRNNLSNSLLHRSSSTSSSSTAPNARLNRLVTRLPPFLRPYLSPLLHAPATHITSFLILHELTAVIPLLGLSALFHYSNWLPEAWTEAKYVSEGVAKYGRWFARKGWFGFTSNIEEVDGERKGTRERGDDVSGGNEQVETETPKKALEEEVDEKWNVSTEGRKILVEVATAYAITKVLLPVRIMVSVWGTPWFARSVLGRFRRVFGGSKSAQSIKVDNQKM